jgi:hypothetical protein
VAIVVSTALLIAGVIWVVKWQRRRLLKQKHKFQKLLEERDYLLEDKEREVCSSLPERVVIP